MTKFAALLILFIVVFTGAIPSWLPTYDANTSGNMDDLSFGGTSLTDPPNGVGVNEYTDTDTPTPTESNELNATLVGDYFIKFLNSERSERGLQKLESRNILTEMAVKHSNAMAEEGEIGHVEADGSTIEDRYRSRGLLPECRLEISGSDKYYPGAENAAKTHVGKMLSVDWTDTNSYIVTDERDLAYALFQMWMHSKGHREAMLVASADQAGLGFVVTDSNVVYASLELC
jgi:uncharacterized protein YkwD